MLARVLGSPLITQTFMRYFKQFEIKFFFTPFSYISKWSMPKNNK